MDKMILISEKELKEIRAKLIQRSSELDSPYQQGLLDGQLNMIANVLASEEVEMVDMNAEQIKYICNDRPDMFEYIKTRGYKLIRNK